LFCAVQAPESSLSWKESLSAPERFASIWNVTFAVADSVKLIATWPVAVSEAVARLWLLPLFGHSMACPPEAAASLTTANGENVL
jgi:hypothetical protein